MKLYHCPGSRSLRIVWLLEELGLDYDLVSMPLGDKQMREPEYLKVHPGGRKIFLGSGRDCTELFQKYHAWVNCHFMIQKYQVGVIGYKK